MSSHNNSSRLFSKLFGHKKQPGFYFKDIHLFSDRETSNSIITALIGDDLELLDPECLDKARARVMAGVKNIFEILYNNADMFLCLRGRILFYDSVAQEINGELFADMLASDIRMLTNAFMLAREAFVLIGREDLGGKPQPATRMTELVDSLLDLQHRSMSLPDQPSFNLPIRLDEVGQLKDNLESFVIRPATVWPPNYFSEEVRAMMIDARMLPCLRGVSPIAQLRRPSLPTTASAAIRIREFLCWHALAHFDSSSTWSLFLNPVADFKDLRDRGHWSCATKGDAAVFAHINSFLDFAMVAFTTNKTSVIGLFAPWFGPRLGETAARKPEAVQTMFINNMARLGIVVVLRRAETNSGSRLELILFDPTNFLLLQQSAYTGNVLRLQNYRSALFEKLAGWATKANSSILSGWIAGPMNREDAIQIQDPISLACDFVQQTTTDAEHEQDPFEYKRLSQRFVLQPISGSGSG
ncbi:hypothetical protein ACHAQA_002995 [Verticillium albo-atrum]